MGCDGLSGKGSGLEGPTSCLLNLCYRMGGGEGVRYGGKSLMPESRRCGYSMNIQQPLALYTPR